MLPTLAIAFSLVLVCALVDRIRIAYEWGIKGNIDHAISWSVAVACCIVQWFIQRPEWNVFAFVVMFFSMRLSFYDPALNLMRREHIDYISSKTTAKTDGLFFRLHIPFWWQRAIGVAILVNTILIQKNCL